MRLSERDLVDLEEPLTLRRLRLWVRKGWIAPITGATGPRFDDLDVARIRLVCQLKDVLALNDDAVAVVLSLMDQLYGVRKELRTLAAAIERQPEGVRREIIRAIRDADGN